ncbi:MAG: dethiobiotin synthetase [Candidatus Binatota bacterium]|nr:dethiobiotin synthetase [Candidatus Binatota bacterium]
MNGLLITGTDTGVGKTLVACAIARALSLRLRVAPFKPVETGCAALHGELRPDDALRLRAAAASDADLELVCPFRYAEPLAPWLAAERAGRPVSIERLHACFARLAEIADLVIVESAGGLLVPLADDYTFADLAHDLDLPLVLVVRSKLGAINHTLLTLECASARGLDVLGYVLNDVDPGRDLARETNRRVLERFARVPCLAAVPHLGAGDDAVRAFGEALASGIVPPVRSRSESSRST